MWTSVFVYFGLKHYLKLIIKLMCSVVIFWTGIEYQEGKGREGRDWNSSGVKNELNHVPYFHPCRSAWSRLNSPCGARDFNSDIKEMMRWKYAIVGKKEKKKQQQDGLNAWFDGHDHPGELLERCIRATGVQLSLTDFMPTWQHDWTWAPPPPTCTRFVTLIEQM